MGHNGSGKTPLLNILSGRLAADGGEVTTRPGFACAMVEQFLPKRLGTRTLVDAGVWSGLKRLCGGVRRVCWTSWDLLLGSAGLRCARYPQDNKTG